MTLEEATRALREEGAWDASRKRALRARVLATPRKRPTRVIRWVMPIAAVLAAASVWASVARERKPSVAVPTPPAATTVPVPVIPVARAMTVTATATVTASAQAPVRVAPRAVARTATTTTKPSIPDDSERRALRAYREAERLQFEDKDYARALDAWDRYIPLAGGSPLLVDARWQRALCLVRLERRDEARAALEPFARGELGAYRRDEAQSLLDGLR